MSRNERRGEKGEKNVGSLRGGREERRSREEIIEGYRWEEIEGMRLSEDCGSHCRDEIKKRNTRRETRRDKWS